MLRQVISLTKARKQRRFIPVKILSKKRDIYTNKQFLNKSQTYSPELRFTLPDDYTLFRGDPVIHNVIPSDLHSLAAVILYGFNARQFPEIITTNHLSNHQGNTAFISLTENKEYAFDVSGDKGVVMVIDAETIGLFVNINQSIQDTVTDNPQLKKEAEYISLLLLYCCIKSFEVENISIVNPFYLSKEVFEANPELTSRLRALQDQFIFLLKNLYGQNNELPEQEIKNALVNFAKEFLSIYDIAYGDKNPFSLPLNIFSKVFPEFSKIAKIDTINDNLTLGQIVLNVGESLIDDHPYLKSYHSQKELDNRSEVQSEILQEKINFLLGHSVLSDEEKFETLKNIKLKQ